MSNLSGRQYLVLAMALFIPGLSLAQMAGPQHACAAVADPDERLACYDHAFPPVAGAGTSLLDVEARRKQVVEEFGLNRQQLLDRTPESLRATAPERIEGVVKSVTVRNNGDRLVTFENGQAWLLNEGTSRGRLQPGDKVAVRQAALGTYMLVTPTRVALRAKRLH